jgi:MFS family permease
MGGGTTLIGFLPTYAMIGVAAPCLLTLLRLIQGIGLGGEWGGAVLLAYEYAPPGHRGLFGSIPQAGITIGLLFSTLFIGFASLLPDDQFFSWGWRASFILSAALLALGLWIRNGIDETPDFKKLQTDGRVARFPVAELLRNYRREVLTAILVKFGETGSFYMFAVFLLSYATGRLGYSRPMTLTAIALGAFVATITIPLCGLLSDRVGRRTVFLTGSAGLIAFRAVLLVVVAAVYCLHSHRLDRGHRPDMATGHRVLEHIARRDVSATRPILGYLIRISDWGCAGWRHGAPCWHRTACP